MKYTYTYLPTYPIRVVPQPGLSSAAPSIRTLIPGPKISEKSADLSLKVGKSGSNSKPLNLFPANPASESPFQEQQTNVYPANIEMSSQSSIVTPKYNALCGMAKCYVMNLLNGMMHQIRVLLDSGANLSLINNDVARKIGLPGDTVNINPVSYTHLRAHETGRNLVCRLLLEK